MLDMHEWSHWKYLGHGVFFISKENFTVEKLTIKYMEIIASLSKDNKLNYELTKIFVEQKNGRVDIISNRDLYSTAKEAFNDLITVLQERTEYVRSTFDHYIVALQNSLYKSDLRAKNWKEIRNLIFELRYLKTRLKHCLRITGDEQAKILINSIDESIESLKTELPYNLWYEMKGLYNGQTV